MLCHSPNRTLYGLKWNSLKRDKLSVADCFPLSAYFSLFFFFPPLLPSNDDPSPLLASLSNIRRQIIAAINPRLIEPNAGCRCLLLAKSISHYKSIGPFLSTRTHLPIKLRHSLSPLRRRWCPRTGLHRPGTSPSNHSSRSLLPSLLTRDRISRFTFRLRFPFNPPLVEIDGFVRGKRRDQKTSFVTAVSKKNVFRHRFFYRWRGGTLLKKDEEETFLQFDLIHSIFSIRKPRRGVDSLIGLIRCTAREGKREGITGTDGVNWRAGEGKQQDRWSRMGHAFRASISRDLGLLIIRVWIWRWSNGRGMERIRAYTRLLILLPPATNPLSLLLANRVMNKYIHAVLTRVRGAWCAPSVDRSNLTHLFPFSSYPSLISRQRAMHLWERACIVWETLPESGCLKSCWCPLLLLSNVSF